MKSGTHFGVNQLLRTFPLLLVSGLFGLTACDGPPLPAELPPKPLADVTIRIECPDTAIADYLQSSALGWSARTGATVQIGTEPNSDADIVIVPAKGLGRLAVTRQFAELPAAYRRSDNPLQWLRILPAYRTLLAQWGSEIVALPLSGDAAFLVYRADLFNDPQLKSSYAKQTASELRPPITWGEYLKVAEFFQIERKKPSLPPLPESSDQLLALFHQVAVCYDRQAMTEAELTTGGRDVAGQPRLNTEEILSFEFDMETGKPRIQRASFAAAANWLANCQPFRADLKELGSDNPAKALADDQAVMAVLTPGQLQGLPRKDGAIDPRFAVSKLPGSRTVARQDGRLMPTDGGVNYVPYLGESAFYAMVRKSSKNQESAWELVAEWVGLVGSLTVIATPELDIGPHRGEQLEQSRSSIWLRFGFDTARTRELATAVQSFHALELGNPALVLRTPNQAELMATLAEQLRATAAGTIDGPDAMRKVAETWEKQIEDHAQFRIWLRASAGLD